MTHSQQVETTTRHLVWTSFVWAGAASTLTSPLTAIWMLLVAPVVVLIGIWRLRTGADASPSTVLSAGLGLLIGPALHIGAGLLLTTPGGRA